MASIGEEVAAFWASGRPRARLREHSRNWKQVRTSYAVSHAVGDAVAGGRGQDLVTTLLDEDFRELRRGLSGTDALRADIRAGLDYFSVSSPDLLRYLQILLVEQQAADAVGMAAQRRHGQGLADFLQLDVLPRDRRLVGVHKVLQRLFAAMPRFAADGQGPIVVTGYELGAWRCACGTLTGLEERYRFACACAATYGTGKLISDAELCVFCGEAPVYRQCPSCRTRVTLENLWRLRDGGGDPSVLQIPLTLHLVVEDADTRTEHSLPLMHLPIPMGVRERDGVVVFDIPVVFWLDEFQLADGFDVAGGFVSLSDTIFYNGQTDTCVALESMFRRVLLGVDERNSYRGFHEYLHRRIQHQVVRLAGLRLTQTFQHRIGSRLVGRTKINDLLRFVDPTVECIVAATGSLRGNAAWVSSRFASLAIVNVPRLVSVKTTVAPGSRLTPTQTNTGRGGLDDSGLIRPGSRAEPGQVLACIERVLSDSDDLSAEERLRRVLFPEREFVRDESLRLAGRSSGRVIAQHVTLPVGAEDRNTIKPARGRRIETAGGDGIGISMTVAVDRRMAVGGTIYAADGDSSVVVCGIRSDWALKNTTTVDEEPDIVVSSEHPWAPAPGTPSRRIRVRIDKDAPTNHGTPSLKPGPYSLHTGQPMAATEFTEGAQRLPARQLRWLAAIGARWLALELYGPRSEAPWGMTLFKSVLSDNPDIAFPTGMPLQDWTGLSDSPSRAIRRVDRLLASARIQARVSPAGITMHLMTDEQVRAASHGVVSPPLPSQAPIAPLFDKWIFGTDRIECACGRPRSFLLIGTTCKDCGEKVTVPERISRMGHIELPVPIVHPWFLHRAVGVDLAARLGVTPEELAAVVRCEAYVATERGDSGHVRGRILPAGEAHGDVRADSARLPTGGEAVETLLRIARQVDLSGDGGLTNAPIVIRTLPVLPAGLRPYTSGPLTGVNMRYNAILQRIGRIPRTRELGMFDNEKFRLEWCGSFQQTANGLFGTEPMWDPELSAYGNPASIADDLIPRTIREWSLRDHLMTRNITHSGAATVVSNDNVAPDTARLPKEMAYRLMWPIASKVLRASDAASGSPAPWKLAQDHPDSVRPAFEAAYARAVVLVALPTGPWPLVALHVQPTDDPAIAVHPTLLDFVGWSNLGQVARIFSILTDNAQREALDLLTPSRLRTLQCVPADRPRHKSFFDLTPTTAIDDLVRAAITNTTVPLAGDEDQLLLCSKEWTDNEAEGTVEPCGARPSSGAPAQPEPVMGLVAAEGDPGPGRDARLVQHTAQRLGVHGLIAVPVERDQPVGGDRAGEFALAFADEVDEAAQVQRIGDQAAVGVGEGHGLSQATPPQGRDEPSSVGELVPPGRGDVPG